MELSELVIYITNILNFNYKYITCNNGLTSLHNLYVQTISSYPLICL